MIQSLAYLGIASPSLAEWTELGTDILGMQAAPSGADGTLRFRMDDAASRLAVHPAQNDELRYIGWTVAGEDAARRIGERLERAGVTVHAATSAELDERQVEGFLRFEDPFGMRHELAWGQFTEPTTFHPSRPMSGFVTGEQGMGHVVLMVPDVAEADRFYSEILGFRPSDRVLTPRTELRFYHVNGRHHSLAVVETPGTSGFHHLMLETRSLDDVGNAQDLCHARGVPVTQTLGRHTNDLVTSFYLYTPSHFRIEYGWGGLQVDDLWTPKSFYTPSIWGHHRPEEHRDLPPGLLVRTPEGDDS